jgi:hypothetical protein
MALGLIHYDRETPLRSPVSGRRCVASTAANLWPIVGFTHGLWDRRRFTSLGGNSRQGKGKAQDRENVSVSSPGAV